MSTRQPTPGVHETFAADVAEAKPQPLGYITPAALEQLRLGIDCQPIHKDTRHGFTVPIFDHRPRMPEPITHPPPESHLRLLREPDNRLERDSVYDISGVIGDFEHLAVDRDAFEHLLAHHFPGRLDGLFIGEVVAGHLRSFRILLENAVFADVEEVSGHVCTSGVSARTSSADDSSGPTLPPASKTEAGDE